jgi:hypothetical protein
LERTQVTEHSPDCRGHFWRDTSGRLTYELHRVSGADYAAVCRLVSRQFRLQASGALVRGLDEVFQEYRSSSGAVSLEWDIWTEFTVVARDAASEALVQGIGAFLGSAPAIDEYLRRL